MKNTTTRSGEPPRVASSPTPREDDTSEAGAIERRLRNHARMMAIVAHELRHPMFRLTLSADHATSLEDQTVALSTTLAAIRDELPNMTRLVEDLEDYGSLEAGCLRLMRDVVDPADIVRSSLVAFEVVARQRQIELSGRIDSELPKIRADRGRLLQVMSNLLANAMCLTPPGGRVVVAVELDRDDDVRISVSDSGPGIAPNDLPHIFEHYWRGNQSRCYAGRGLGLAIARSLVEAHRGEIWAENQSSGGARFVFTVRSPLTSPR